jgi:hypothetical protein
LEKAVGDKGMDMGVKVQILAKGVDGHDAGGDAIGHFEGGLLVFNEAFLGQTAEVFDQVAVVLKVGAQHFWNGEHIVTMGYRGQNVFRNELGGGLDVLLVAGGAEPTAFAGESQKVFFLAVVASNAGKTPFQVAAIHEFANDVGNDRAEGANLRLIDFLVYLDKLVEAAVENLPQGRLFRVSGAIKLHEIIRQYKEDLCHPTAQAQK